MRMDQNEKVKSAISDIAIIKQTIGKSRVQMKRLSQVFFLYGVTQFIWVAAFWITNFLIRDFNIPFFTFILMMNLLDIAIFVFYYIWRRELKKTDNNYTLYAYDTWGFALFLIPMIWSVTLILFLLFPSFVTEGITYTMMMFYGLAEQMLFFLAVGVTGFLLNCEDWKILSIVFVCAYFLSFILFGGIPDLPWTIGAASLIGQLISVQAFWAMICPLIAIAMGFYFKIRNKE